MMTNQETLTMAVVSFADALLRGIEDSTEVAPGPLGVSRRPLPPGALDARRHLHEAMEAVQAHNPRAALRPLVDALEYVCPESKRFGVVA